jgi:hypothetical protein
MAGITKFCSTDGGESTARIKTYAIERLAFLLFQKGQNFLRMLLSLLHRGPMLDHIALGPDHHGRANRALYLFAVHHFLAEGAILFHDFAVWVGEQDIRQIELGGKLIMRINTVFAYAQHCRIGLLELWIQLAEPASFLGSARRAVFRIEIQDYGLAFKFVQGMLVPIIAGQAERRRLSAFETLHAFSSRVLSPAYIHKWMKELNSSRYLRCLTR